MTVFDNAQISSIRSDCSATWATTNVQILKFVQCIDSCSPLFQSCESMGMILAEITDSTIADNVKAFLDSIDPSGSNQYWLGLKYVTSSSTFAWNSGAPYSYNNWDSNYPSRYVKISYSSWSINAGFQIKNRCKIILIKY